MPLARSFRAGHTETWGVLQVQAGPSGPQKPQRGLSAPTEPRTVPPLGTWYLGTTLPAPGAAPAAQSPLASADVAAIGRL